MKGRFEGARRWRVLLGVVVTCGMATAVPAASAATFAARETHRGLVVNRADGMAGSLAANSWFRRPGEPAFVYREGGAVVAGVWLAGAEGAVVRGGTTEKASPIGRIVPSWTDDQLSLTIEPSGGAAVQTTVFQRRSGGGDATLNRRASTLVALEGTYRAMLQVTGGGEVGWLEVDIDPEGATRFTGDLPPAISPALAAAAAAAVDAEVDLIYGNVVDVGPLRR